MRNRRSWRYSASPHGDLILTAAPIGRWRPGELPKTRTFLIVSESTWCDRGGRSPRAPEVQIVWPHMKKPRGERPWVSMPDWMYP